MRVLRVETKEDCYGPYRGPLSLKELQRKYSSTAHPTPCSDGGISEWWEETDSSITEAYFCGFKNMRQLTNWFPRDIWDIFYDHNDIYSNKDQFGIAQYDVDFRDVIIGEKQLLFKTIDATRLSFTIFQKKNIIRRALDTVLT